MKIFRRYILFCILIGCAVMTAGQTKRVAELEQSIYHARNGDEQLRAMVALCYEYKSVHRDTLDHYCFLARAMAQTSTDKRLRKMANLVVAYDYLRWGWIDSVIATVDPLIEEDPVTNADYRDIYFQATRLKAIGYGAHSRYQEGLAILYRIVSEAEIYKDSATLAENYNSIASFALARNQPAEAFTWLQRAISFCADKESMNAVKAAIYVNMADAFHQKDKNDSANFYIDKGVALFKETQNLSNLALALQRQSTILMASGKLTNAEAALKEMAAVRGRLGDGPVYQDENLSLIDYYIQTKQIQKAIETCKQLLVKGDLHIVDGKKGETVFSNSIMIRLGYYEALAKCYKITGETAQYTNTLEDIIVAKDSLYKYNSARAIAELQTKYEVQKKETTIIRQQLDIARKNSRFYILLGSAFFLAIIAFVLFTEYRRREKIQAERSVAAAEENERKRIAADLHDNLGAYAAAIVSNLDLAEHSLAKPSEIPALGELRNNSQAIVSQLNDTIWAMKKDALSATALSDRVKIFVQRIQQSYPNINISVMEDIDRDLILVPSHALHLFRIVQEAVNNALRHSRASEVSINVVVKLGLLEISIADNGTGMPEMINNGNGLANMKERAEQTGWNIGWLPREGGGTIVHISSRRDNK